jgi:hypothetical protein
VPNAPLVAKGVECTVVFDGATLAFHPDVFARLRARVTRRDSGARVVPIAEVVAVGLVESTFALNGHVRFTFATDDDLEDDDDPRPSPPNAAAAAKRAARDPNAVMFSRYQAKAFTALRDAVATAITARDPD